MNRNSVHDVIGIKKMNILLPFYVIIKVLALYIGIMFCLEKFHDVVNYQINDCCKSLYFNKC